MKRKKNADKFDNSLPEIEQWMPTGSLSIPDNSVNFLKKEVQPMSNSLATGVDDVKIEFRCDCWKFYGLVKYVFENL